MHDQEGDAAEKKKKVNEQIRGKIDTAGRENKKCTTKESIKKASTAGFEPAQAKPNRFRVCLLNHSDISTYRAVEAVVLNFSPSLVPNFFLPRLLYVQTSNFSVTSFQFQSNFQF